MVRKPTTSASKRPTKAAAKSSSSKAGASVVTLRQLAADIAETHEMPKRTAEAVLNDTIALVSKNLVKGNKVRINGLGIFQVKKRAARMGRNPQTGEPVKIKASKKIAFRAGKELKEAV